jgi:hypothetical protein
VDNGSESTVTTSGLKWDLRSASSPRVEEESNLSAKSESEQGTIVFILLIELFVTE